MSSQGAGKYEDPVIEELGAFLRGKKLVSYRGKDSVEVVEVKINKSRGTGRKAFPFFVGSRYPDVMVWTDRPLRLMYRNLSVPFFIEVETARKHFNSFTKPLNQLYSYKYATNTKKLFEQHGDYSVILATLDSTGFVNDEGTCVVATNYISSRRSPDINYYMTRVCWGLGIGIYYGLSREVHFNHGDSFGISHPTGFYPPGERVHDWR